MQLARYFAKHIGCRVASNAGKVPASLIAFLDGDSDKSEFAWTEFCLSSSALADHEKSRQRLGMHQTVGEFSDETRSLTTLKGALSRGALQFVWDVNLDPTVVDDAPGVLARDVYPLRNIDDDLCAHRFLVW